jgi:CheY-like chemotaxis protein
MLVLAVDDDDDDLELFCDTVKAVESSANVIIARHGDEALDYLLKEAVTMPDIIFLDINMPKRNGRDCLKMIKAERQTKYIPVVMYSTTLSPEDKALFDSLGARFMTKSASYTESIEVLRRLFQQLRTESLAPLSLNELCEGEE